MYIDNFDKWFWSIAVLICAAIFALVVWVESIDNEQWEQFAAEHHCTLVGVTEPSTSIGINTGKGGGVMPVMNPGSKSYKCDDGLVHTRAE